VAWDGDGEKYYKKNFLAINQPREDLELRNSYSTDSTVQVRYVYGTRLVLKQKRGLELEMEYSALHEDYMYVCILFVHGTRRICTQCTVCVAWSWCGNLCCQRCRIRYWNIRYYI